MGHQIATAAKGIAATGFFAVFIALLLLKFIWSTWSAEALIVAALGGAALCVVGLGVAKIAGGSSR